MKQNKNIPETILVPEWYRPGGDMMYKRGVLPPEHPGSIYNYIKKELKLAPENYGYFLSPINKLFHNLDVEVRKVKMANSSIESCKIIDTISNIYITALKKWFREESDYSLDNTDLEQL